MSKDLMEIESSVRKSRECIPGLAWDIQSPIISETGLG